MQHAKEFLQESIDILNSRAKEYDKEEQDERSMGRIVDTFNTISGCKLTEREGYLFMMCLKLVRLHTKTDVFHKDSIIDAISYAALAGESWSVMQDNEYKFETCA